MFLLNNECDCCNKIKKWRINLECILYIQYICKLYIINQNKKIVRMWVLIVYNFNIYVTWKIKVNQIDGTYYILINIKSFLLPLEYTAMARLLSLDGKLWLDFCCFKQLALQLNGLMLFLLFNTDAMPRLEFWKILILQ